MVPALENLSRALLLWVLVSVVLLALYFATQQDISVERGKDDRRRRLVLRTKCLYAMAGSSLFSLTMLLCAINIDPAVLIRWLAVIEKQDFPTRPASRIVSCSRDDL